MSNAEARTRLLAVIEELKRIAEMLPEDAKPVPQPQPKPPKGGAARPTIVPVFGLHGPPDFAYWGWTQEVYRRFELARPTVQSAFVMTGEPGHPVTGEQIRPLFDMGIKDVRARLAVPGEHAGSPEQFVAYCRNSAVALYQSGVRHFTIGNEPNFQHEGLGKGWQNGQQFGTFALRVRDMLSAQMPDAIWHFPAPSPNHTAPIQEGVFLEQARSAIEELDWLDLHAYYWVFENVDEQARRIAEIEKRFPNKPIAVTEHSCPNPDIPMEHKGHWHVDFVWRLANYTRNVHVAYVFIVSGRQHWPYEAITDEVAAFYSGANVRAKLQIQ